MIAKETAGKLISGIVFFTGYVQALFDKNKQAWHDKLVSSVVMENTGYE